MSQYTVTLADNTTIVRARKDAAIAAAQKTGLDYVITSKSGAVVADTEGRIAAKAGDAAPAAPAPSPEPTPAPEAEAPAPAATPKKESTVAKSTEFKAQGRPRKSTVPEVEVKKGETVALYDMGSLAFTATMLKGGQDLAAKKGLESRISVASLALVLSGGTAKDRAAVAKQAREMWVHVYGEFRDWKAGRRELRRKQLETTDGRRQMLVEEREFFAARMADFIKSA
jgi:hypothetical protein